MEHFSDILRALNTWNACGGLLVLSGLTLLMRIPVERNPQKGGGQTRMTWPVFLLATGLIAAGIGIWIWLGGHPAAETPTQQVPMSVVEPDKTHVDPNPMATRKPSMPSAKTLDRTASADLPREGFSCGGQLTDADTREPIAGAVIVYRQKEWTSNSEGYFQISLHEIPVRDERIVVRIAHPQYTAISQPLIAGNFNTPVLLSKK